MKKIFMLLLTIILLCCTALVFAEEAENKSATEKPQLFSERLKNFYAEQEKEQRRNANLENMPKVAVLYINNSQTTYNDEIDKVMFETLQESIDYATYQYIDGAPYIERLSKIGIVDITTAERADIIDAFEGEDIDYVVFLQIDPFIRKDKVTFFTVGKEMTAQIPFKIIDIKNNKYLYNGKFTEIAKDSSMLGDIGNKSVALKAIDAVKEKISSIIDVRLPKTKAVMNYNAEK